MSVQSDILQKPVSDRLLQCDILSEKHICDMKSILCSQTLEEVGRKYCCSNMGGNIIEILEHEMNLSL